MRRELNKKLKKQDQERTKEFKTVPVLHNPVFYGQLRLKIPQTRSVSSSKPAFEPTSRPPSMISTALEFMNHESKISQKLHLSLGLKPPKMFGSLEKYTFQEMLHSSHRSLFPGKVILRSLSAII